jgi:hypothetical protein
MAATARIFPHYKNADGDFDSICPDCFTTIFSKHLENDLHSSEVNHVCAPALLRALWGRNMFF